MYLSADTGVSAAIEMWLLIGLMQIESGEIRTYVRRRAKSESTAWMRTRGWWLNKYFYNCGWVQFQLGDYLGASLSAHWSRYLCIVYKEIFWGQSYCLERIMYTKMLLVDNRKIINNTKYSTFLVD